MGKSRAVIYKFDKVNKARIKGRVKHTRTGACTAKRGQRCQHGRTH